MDGQMLRESIAKAPLADRLALERLYLYVTAGDAVKPDFSAYAEEASDYQGFFNAVYEDDSQKRTSVWAEWAKLKRKSWINRFQPHIALQGLRLKSDGLPVEFGTGIMLAPTGSRDNIANFYVFESGSFNTEAATFVTSIGGSFSCAGYDFKGIYGVYCYRGSVIFEAWEAEDEPRIAYGGDR